MRPKQKRKRCTTLMHTKQKMWHRKADRAGEWASAFTTGKKCRWETIIRGQYNKSDIVCLKGGNGVDVSVVTAKIRLTYYTDGSFRVHFDIHMLDYFLSFREGGYIESQIAKAVEKGHTLSETLLLCQILNTDPYHG